MNNRQEATTTKKKDEYIFFSLHIYLIYARSPRIRRAN
jgi:hypothetical protein